MESYFTRNKKLIDYVMLCYYLILPSIALTASFVYELIRFYVK